MKRIVASMLALLLCTTPAAQARPGCSGCNIVDIGAFGPSLVGATVYIDRLSDPNIPVTVENVDTYQERAYVRGPNGDEGWISARELYGPEESRERDDNTVAGTALGIAALLAAMAAASSSSSSSSDSGSSSNSGQTYRQHQYQNQDDDEDDSTAEEPRPDTSAGCAWGDRSYGTCH